MGEGSGRFGDGQEELGEVYRSYLKKVCQTDGRTWEGLEVLPHLITYTSINQENDYFSFISCLMSEECL